MDQLIAACRAPDATADSICASMGTFDLTVHLYVFFEHIVDDRVLCLVLNFVEFGPELWFYLAFKHRSSEFCFGILKFSEFDVHSALYYTLKYSMRDTAAKVRLLLEREVPDRFDVRMGMEHEERGVRVQFGSLSSMLAVCLLETPPAVMWRVYEAVVTQ